MEVSTSKLTFRPSIYRLIIQDDQILLNRHISGKYELPGGGIDLGEDLADALDREIMEETGLEVDIDHSQPLHVAGSFFKLSDDDVFQKILIFY